MARVTKIEARRKVVFKRVAAYCRVSTEKDAQLYSLENQMKAGGRTGSWWASTPMKAAAEPP